MFKFTDTAQDIISGKRVNTLMVISSLMFWGLFFPITRNEFNSIYNYLSNYFGWKFEWYRFIEGLSHFESIRMLFAFIYIISMIGMLKYPVFKDSKDDYIGNGVPSSWLIISIIFLILGNFAPYAPITLPLLYIIALIFCAIREKSSEKREEKFFGLIVICLVLISPLIILWSILWNAVSGKSSSRKS